MLEKQGQREVFPKRRCFDGECCIAADTSSKIRFAIETTLL